MPLKIRVSVPKWCHWMQLAPLATPLLMPMVSNKEARTVFYGEFRTNGSRSEIKSLSPSGILHGSRSGIPQGSDRESRMGPGRDAGRESRTGPGRDPLGSGPGQPGRDPSGSRGHKPSGSRRGFPRGPLLTLGTGPARDPCRCVGWEASPGSRSMYLCMYVCMLHFYRTICTAGHPAIIVGTGRRKAYYIQTGSLNKSVSSLFLKLCVGLTLSS